MEAETSSNVLNFIVDSDITIPISVPRKPSDTNTLGTVSLSDERPGTLITESSLI